MTGRFFHLFFIFFGVLQFASASGGVRGTKEKHLDKCRTCVYVLETIKKTQRMQEAPQFLLPSICVEIFSKTGDDKKGKKDYAYCHQTLASLSTFGNEVRNWLSNGCYKVEEYGALEKIIPCPSHVICSQMQDLEKKAFCREPASDFPTKEVEEATALGTR